MSTSETFIHRVLLTPNALDTIKSFTGWNVEGSWEVSSRRWRFRGHKFHTTVIGGDRLVTVFHYGKRAVVFLDGDLFAFTTKYIVTDFTSPSSFVSRDKYVVFDEHRGHNHNPCTVCRPKR